jgi:hypothetical protein
MAVGLSSLKPSDDYYSETNRQKYVFVIMCKVGNSLPVPSEAFVGNVREDVKKAAEDKTSKLEELVKEFGQYTYEVREVFKVENV